jgi:hypothetical protein
MSTLVHELDRRAPHPVDLRVAPMEGKRNRMTTGFRLFLAVPHLLLVGAPVAAALTWTMSDRGAGPGWGSGGVLGAAAGVSALIAWFAILFTGTYPEGLRALVTYYLRWRVRAVAYTALLRDEYPPFGDGAYPAELVLAPVDAPRDRLSVGFRLILAIPHLVCVWALSIAWFFTTIVAWLAILLDGHYPEPLYRFGMGVFRWNIRVEAYLLLLHDAYPPFTLE